MLSVGIVKLGRSRGEIKGMGGGSLYDNRTPFELIVLLVGALLRVLFLIAQAQQRAAAHQQAMMQAGTMPQ